MCRRGSTVARIRNRPKMKPKPAGKLSDLAKQHEAFERFTSMTKEQLAAATAEYEDESAEDRFRELTPAERRQWERIRRGRPMIGGGAKAIPVSIETGLLGRATKYANKLKISRSQLIAQSLSDFMAKGGRVPSRKAALTRKAVSKMASRTVVPARRVVSPAGKSLSRNRARAGKQK